MDEERLKRAEELTETNPTQEQIDKDNYTKGVVELSGFKIAIENPVGSTRKGVDDNGKHWSITMSNTYGYFMDSVGADGEGVDVFIGEDIDSSFDVYVINQTNRGRLKFDEHKVMFGFSDESSAVKAYLKNYEEGWDGFHSVVALDLKSFHSWLYTENKTIPIKNRTFEMNYEDIQGNVKVNIVKMKGEVIEGETLKSLMQQAGEIKKGESLALEIASPGGSVLEGLKIMEWLEKLANQGVQIITIVTANAYSIASLIMLASNIRLISKHGKVMVHNPMVPELSYVNANELEKHVNSLRELEGHMYSLYTKLTGLSEEEIKLLMDNETYLKPNEAVKNGFADMVVNVKETPYEMASKQEKQVNMLGTVNMLKNIIAKVNGDKFVNQLYYDDGGSTVEIYQADPAQYQVGDRASVEEGEVVLSDGCKLVIKGGVIEDIVKGEIEAPIEAPQGEVAPVVAPMGEPMGEPIGEVAPIEEEVVSGEFSTGQAPVEPTIKSKDEMPATVTETVESTISTKETIAQAEEKEVIAQAPAEEVVAEVVTPKEEMVSMPVEAFKAMEEEMRAMKAKMTSYEEKMVSYETEMKSIGAESDKFQNTAAEAIETLAKNTVSGFKPEAVSSVLNPSASSIGKNSIFQTLRRQNKA